ncbi:negative regulator of the PHO system [Histomonas meleagridis]|uniref:negative regulator of the PHO system n=1 Tax=Histomonas meleagridis TaxID=135588 RepID=UPI0035595C6F|nr:negative regulator of the PHO system [Histomonas meleagridis]KAH0801827.1 negative regulator of the PHO system [Histomonas meleagridis]
MVIPVGEMSTEVITQWYRPPEILLGITDYGFCVDVWSAGCVIAEMLTGEPLFPCQDNDNMIIYISHIFGKKAITDSFPDMDLDFIEETDDIIGLDNIFEGCDPLVLDLLKRLLEIDPKKRITASDALKMPVFNRFRENQ